MTAVADDPIKLWVSRTAQLEEALRRGGHTRLLPTVRAVERVLAGLQHADVEHRSDAIVLVSRAFRAVRASLTTPGATVDEVIMDELERVALDLDRREQSELALENDSLGASSFLDSLASAADDELSALAGSVRRIEVAAPQDGLGTLREPLASKRNGNAGAAQGGARVLMKGELGPGLLADLIQLFAQNVETGMLAIEGEGVSASIYFQEGKISDAECGDEVGEKAFFRSMLVRQGRFSYQRGVEAKSVRIFRSAQHLIMETLRLMDESS